MKKLREFNIEDYSEFEELMNEVRHSNLYGAIEDFYKKHPELSASLDLSTIVFIHELKVIIDGIK